MKTISMDLKLSIRFGASGLEDQARSLLHVDHSGKKTRRTTRQRHSRCLEGLKGALIQSSQKLEIDCNTAVLSEPSPPESIHVFLRSIPD